MLNEWATAAYVDDVHSVCFACVSRSGLQWLCVLTGRSSMCSEFWGENGDEVHGVCNVCMCLYITDYVC